MATEPTIEQRLARVEEAVVEIQRQLAGRASAPTGETGPAAPGEARAPATGAGAQASSAGALGTAAPPAIPFVPGTPAAPAPRPAAAAATPPPKPAAPPRDWAATAQLWIGRAGIALLMLGLAFLYRYAVSRGWLTPVMRVGFGLVVGVTMIGVGWRLSRSGGRRAYGLLLMGGGLGVLYVSAYAAFGFYALVSAPVAIGALAVMALFGVWLASDRDQVLLALLGALGAFAAPVLVRTAHPSIPLFSGYIVLVSAWTGWTAVREGWRSLAWTTALGAITVLTLAASGVHPPTDEWLLTAAATLSLLGLVAAVLGREHAATLHPGAWRRRPLPSLPFRAASAPSAARSLTPERLDLVSAGWLTVVATLSFAVYVGGALKLRALGTGALAIGEAALLALVAWSWRRSDPRLARAATLAATAPLLLGTAVLDRREYRGLFALEALGMLALARRTADPWLARIGHAVFLVIALIYLAFLMSPHVSSLPPSVIVADAVAVAAGFVAMRLVSARVPGRVYGAGALLALLGWLYATLAPLPGGAYLVTVSWGVLGSGLLVAAWLANDDTVRAGALVALAMVALKLLLVDTARLPLGGRIVVFIGFGVLFLALGALYRGGALARKPPAPGGEARPD